MNLGDAAITLLCSDFREFWGGMINFARIDRARLSLLILVAAMPIAAVWLIIAPSPASAANGSVIYTYDALGRVTTAAYDTGVIVIYTYDSNGNRTSQTINVNTGTLTWTTAAIPCTANCWGSKLW